MILQVLLFSVLAILIGLGLAFFGYAAFRIIFPIWGFLIGLWLGGEFAASVFGGGFLTTSLGIIVGIVLGLIFAVLAYYVYAFAVVLWGATLGYALGAGLMAMLGLTGFLNWVVGVTLAVVFAVVFISTKMPRVALMVVTAFAGSAAIIAGIMALFGQIPPNQLGLAMIDNYIRQSWFWWMLWFAFGTFGAVVQNQMATMADSMVPASYSYDAVVKEADKKSKNS